jgi:hypothetical protein
MGDLIPWVWAHWDDIVTIAAAVVALGSLVAKLTPSTKDDELWAKAARAVALPGLRKPKGGK